MTENEPVDAAAVALDAEAIDDALAAFEDACAQLIHAAGNATIRPNTRRHLDAIRDQLTEVSAPVTSATADSLVVSAADARAALQRVVVPEDVTDGSDADDLSPLHDEIADEAAGNDLDDDGRGDGAGDDGELAVSDPVPEPAEPPAAPAGYRACTSLPIRNLPHVLVFENGRWQRAAIVFAADDTLTVRPATTRSRSRPGRPLDQYIPAQIALPHFRG